MATRVSAVNSSNAFWQDYEIQGVRKDHVGVYDHGVVKIDSPLIGVPHPSFENLTVITDSNFGYHTDVDGSTTSFSIDVAKANTGSNSLSINCTVNSGAQSPVARLTSAAQSFGTSDKLKLLPAKEGQVYKVSGYIEVASVSSGNAGGAYIAVRAVGEDGSFVDILQQSSLITGTAAFAQEAFEYTAPAGTKYLQFEMGIQDETGQAWFDDISISEKGSDLLVTESDIPANTVKVNTGTAYVNVDRISDFSNFTTKLEVTAAEDLSINANVSGNPRIDLVVARVDIDTDANINADNIGILEIVEGTADPSPVAPSVPNNAIPLAEVSVANGQTTFTNTDISDVRSQYKYDEFRVQPGAGSDDAASKGDMEKAATDKSKGAVVVTGAQNDPNRPVAVGVNDPAFVALSGLTATDTEINQVCDGVGGTVTAANLTELTDTSETTLHSHAGLSSNNGVGSYDPDTTGNLNIAHGLSGTPKEVKIRAIIGPVESTVESDGTWSDTSGDCVIYRQDNSTVSTSTAYIIYLTDATASDTARGAVTAVDGTNITINRTKSGTFSSGVIVRYMWFARL